MQSSKRSSYKGTDGEEEMGLSEEEGTEYTNTITSLIELPSKQSATLKKMTRPKQVDKDKKNFLIIFFSQNKVGKNAPSRQSSLSNLSSLFKNRRITKQEQNTNLQIVLFNLIKLQTRQIKIKSDTNISDVSITYKN